MEAPDFPLLRQAGQATGPDDSRSRWRLPARRRLEPRDQAKPLPDFAVPAVEPKRPLWDAKRYAEPVSTVIL